MRKLFLCALFIFLFTLPAGAAEGLPPFIRVGLEREFRGVSRLDIGNNHITVGYNIEGTFSPLESIQSEDGFTAEAGSGQIIFYAAGQTVLTPDDSSYPIQIRDTAGGFMYIGASAYMNTIELYRPYGQNITAVNVLTPQEYLYSVVPSEMPVDFHPEALKAQAVAARNYLLTRMGIHAEQGYDMCDLGHCMAYRGADRNHEAGIAAVNETEGEMIYYEGEPINAVFFSSSGGATEDSENVWTEPLPYLRGVEDETETEPLVWTRTFSWDELSGILAANGDFIGEAVNVEVTGAGAGGRVLELTIYGESGSKTLTKEEIRTYFSLSAGGALESRNFALEGGTVQAMAMDFTVTDGEVYDTFETGGFYGISPDGQARPIEGRPEIHNLTLVTSASGGDGVTFSGRGWGHGVGMSQRGADGLAQQGYTYRDILLHYYSGVEIY